MSSFSWQDLTNINLFMVAKEVEDTLSRKDISKCLAWCHDNKSKLRKMKSTLEFNVRLQVEQAGFFWTSAQKLNNKKNKTQYQKN